VPEVKLNPYLNFPSISAEALEHYKSVFGGTLTITKFGDTPGAKPHNEDLVMHAVLESDAITLMASDGMKDADIVTGTNVALALSGDDTARLTGYFEALSEDGKVLEPLSPAPWGDTFGMLIDKYGIQWLFNIGAEK
jgi:PhnB protein